MKTEDLLQKYVSTGLSRDERFELEKRALEDDFLADAWEGLQLHQGSDLRQKWNAIQSEWNNKTQTTEKVATKVIAMRPWMQYAAAAAVLLLGAALFFMRSDESLSNMDSAVALDPIEVTDEQEAASASESDESITVISDLEEREEVEEEMRIQAKAKKIMPLSKTTQGEPSTEVVSKKTQSPPTPQRSSNIAFDGTTKTELAANETQNSLVRPTPSPIPNTKPSTEERAAIPVEKNVEDFGNVEIINANEAPIIAKIENPDPARKKSGSLLNSKNTSNDEAIRLSDLKEGTKLTAPQKGDFPTATRVEGLKKNLLDNSKFANVSDQAQLSIQKARSLFLKEKDYEGARNEALKALSINPRLAEAYELIGDIYSTASYTCSEDKWNQSLAVLAAYDQFVKASALNSDPFKAKQLKTKMTTLRDRFPTKDEGFMRGAKPGDSAQVGCWINETVAIRYQ